jgi:aspartyl-tRNA(Asn)/glutamyl-tRNA(Gln) amidotransferase subunit B
MAAYEPVIGLEVHAQLSTRTKIFCGCSTVFGQPPNSQTCAVCLGHPGALPVLNRRAVELGLRSALALGCAIPPRSVFARKNYFYPDLPKGYQISQYEEPLATGGQVVIEIDGRSKRIGLIRLHLEEDAGKSVHEGLPDADRYSYVDLNRAGVPLAEIVSEPELHNAEEAYRFLERLRSVLRYAGTCDGNMEQGSLRCDANVSVRRRGQRELGQRTELKNLNSFRNVQRAVDHEVLRQCAVLDSGGTVVQQTVQWDAVAGVTRPMRGKEDAEDYRYFPEPDLLPLEVGPEWVEEIRRTLPEMPGACKARLAAEYGVSEHEAHLLSLEPERARFFEAVARESGLARAAANWVLNDLLRAQNERGLDENTIPLPARHLAELLRLVDQGTVGITAARREVFPEMLERGVDPLTLVRDRGLTQVHDESAIEELVRQVLAENPTQVAAYRAGKAGLLAWFVGLVMKRSGGRAHPARVAEVLRSHLA